MRTAGLVLLLGLGCRHEADQSAAAVAQSSALEAETERFFEPQTQLRFPLPSGVSVEVKHYDPTLPLKKFRHALHLSTASTGVAVLIDVWDNPTHRALRPWFEEHLSFLIDAETRQSTREVTAAKVEAIVLEQPRSPQAPSMAVATFAHGSRIFRVSCVDFDGLGSALPRWLFDQLLEHLELGVAP